VALASRAKAFRKETYTPRRKIIPITEHFQHFLADMKKRVSGGTCTGRPSKHGNGFSSCSRSGSATDFAAGDSMSGGEGNGESIAMATTIGIS
jgi:hypothetical protein